MDTTPLLAGISQKRIATDRLEIAYLEAGTGSTPIVLLHGNTSSSLFFQDFMLALAACEAEAQRRADTSYSSPAQPLLEPLSPREREVLQLMAQGLSNQEMSERLFLALSTVKGHNQKIFGKLQVQRRTEAVARARALGLL